MTAFMAIVRLTFKNGVRSHIFQLLLFVLLLCIVLIPANIAGDGTARGFIQISLKYSLAAVAFVLSLSSIWLGCFIMSRDAESYQLHMVVSKPISRIVIWLGKWTGIVLIHLILLAIAAGTVYSIVTWKFYRQPFTDADKAAIENEVMVGRRVFFPEVPDINNLAKDMLKQKIAAGSKLSGTLDTSEAGQDKMLKEIKRELMAQMSEVPPGGVRVWTYKGLPAELDRPLYLRYRVYVNKISTEFQRLTRGLWQVVIATPDTEAEKPTNVFEQNKNKEKQYKYYYYPLTQYPEQMMCGVFLERYLPPKVITPEREVVISFSNFDSENGMLYFQRSDGPKLMIKVSGFTENYCRAIFVIFLQLVVLAGLACAAASTLSMPTAVFFVISYLMFGSFATFMASSSFFDGTADYIGYFIGKLMLLCVIPMQEFEVTHFVADGELIEWSFIGKLFLSYFVLRGMPLFLLGMYLYWRRELGLVVRKYE